VSAPPLPTAADAVTAGLVIGTDAGPAAGTDGAGPGAAERRSFRMGTQGLAGAGGIVALLVIWYVLAVTVFKQGHAVPTPTAVAKQYFTDWHLYPVNISQTVKEAAWGWLVGNGLAIGLAIVFFGVPIMERVLMQIGVASYCLPIIAVGPILTTVFNHDTPQIALAGISVFFTTMIGTLLGLRAADAASLDVVRAAGGGAIKQMRYVRLRAALPSTFAALQIAAPAAVLGAIIGEFLGGDKGLGLAMVNAQQALEVSRTWGIALMASAIAGAGYAITALIARLLTPWAPRGGPNRAGGGS
jgi:ABC-type nitrate/sulfonate/bicarbonate transport system permease component